MKTFALAMCAMTFAAAPLLAETVVQDTDGNGSCSMAELLVIYPDLTEEAYVAMDTDESGELSVEELETAMAADLLPS